MPTPKALFFDVFGTCVDWRSTVVREAAALGLPERFALATHAADLDEAQRDELNRVWHRLDPWPDTVPGLTRLKERFVIAPVSNANIALLVNMARHARLPWDAILGAELARAYRPQPPVYLRSAEALGIAPGEAMMVAAHNDDLVAAARVGLMTAFVPRPTEHGPGQTSDVRAQARYDVVATDLVDLANALTAPIEPPSC